MLPTVSVILSTNTIPKVASKSVCRHSQHEYLYHQDVDLSLLFLSLPIMWLNMLERDVGCND